MAALARPIAAQNPDRTIHLWVDPRYGHTASAFQFNPLPGSVNQFADPSHSNPSCHSVGQQPRAAHPLLEVRSVGAANRPLLHAPFPFRTVTGAIQYLQDPLGGIQATTNGASPFTPPGAQFVSANVIIHCLPGLYQQDQSAAGPVPSDPHNLMQPNGETFPIRLPNRVSIQGTSALNTVFEPIEGVGPIFEFGIDVSNVGKLPVFSENWWSFIDSVSLTGAIRRFDSPSNQRTAVVQSAIAVRPFAGPGFPVHLNVSNCFIYCNGIGVLVDSADVPGQPQVEQPEADRHRLNLINNTFVWNLIGVWNGQMSAPIDAPRDPSVTPPVPPPSSIGWARVASINNIFDSSPPTSGDPNPAAGLPMRLEVPIRDQFPGCTKSVPRGMQRWRELLESGPATMVVGPNTIVLPWVNGMSNFEGFDEEELEAVVAGPATDFNAYESGRFNRGIIGQGLELTYEDMQLTVFQRVGAMGLEPDLPFTQGSRFAVGASNPNFFPSITAIDISPFTGGAARVGGTNNLQNLRVRGALYVRDVLHVGAWAPGDPYRISCEFDQSPTDFRLSPVNNSFLGSAAPRAGSMVLVGVALQPSNPLSNAGLDQFPAQMNVVMVGNPPPPPPIVPEKPVPLADTLATGDAFLEFDCEGFGNPRTVDVRMPLPAGTSPNDPGSGLGTLRDIGADELDANLVAGYRAQTTMFMVGQASHPTGTVTFDNDHLFFLGPHFVAPSGLSTFTVPPPTHSLWPPVQNYTIAGLPNPLYIPRFVDTTPHLLPDDHPFHFYNFPPAPNLFPTNWVWEPCAISSWVNEALFLDPLADVVHPTGSSRLVGHPVYSWLDIRAGHPHPLTSFMLVSLQQDATIMGIEVFDLFAKHVGPAIRPSFHPSLASEPGGTAMRFSLEFAPPWCLDRELQTGIQIQRRSNLQSFSVHKL